MTAPATTRRAGPFNGNGVTTSFPFTFKVFAATDIAVILTSAGIDTTLGSGAYSVTLNADQDASPGGSVTYSPLALGERLTIVGALPYDQTADLPTGGNYRAQVVENALDRTVFQIQQLVEVADRTLTLPASAAGADTALPVPEANKVIAWNATADGLVNLDSADLASVVVAGTAYTDIFSGTGAQVAFALTANPGTVNALDVSISGVSQVNGVDFTVSGTTLTFTSAPPAGSGNVCVRYVAALPVGTSSAADVTFSQTTTYPQGSVGRALQAWVNVKNAPFNAVGDGSADDTAAIVAAITYAQATLRNVYFPSGVYKISSTITLSGSPCALIGEIDAPMQQGSTRPSVTVRWYGGATPMFISSGSGWTFEGMAFDNFGTATDWLECTGGQHYVFRRLSFLVGSGASRFSRSVVYANGNQLGYSQFETIHCQGAAPRFIYIDGKGSSNGVTPFSIFGRSVFESNSLGTMSVVYVIDETVDAVCIRDNTFNQQTNELCVVHTEDNLQNPSITSLVIVDNEFDTNLSVSTDRYLRLKNVRNAVIDNNIWNGGGIATALAEVSGATTVASFQGNYIERINGPFFNADTTARVYPGMNDIQLSNTDGIINDSASGSGIIPLTYGTTVTLTGHRARSGDVFRVDVTNGVAWTLSLEHPGIGGTSFFYRGQVIGLQVRNVSGGAMGAISLVGGGYIKLAGGAMPVPANGTSRTVWMVWDGAALVEVARTTVDVPN